MPGTAGTSEGGSGIPGGKPGWTMAPDGTVDNPAGNGMPGGAEGTSGGGGIPGGGSDMPSIIPAGMPGGAKPDGNCIPPPVSSAGPGFLGGCWAKNLWPAGWHSFLRS